jgi:hypothetical protein
MYKIIEDHSPYYITFTYPGFEDVVNYCRKFKFLWSKDRLIHPMTSVIFPEHVGSLILNTSNLPRELEFEENRVGLFITKPGGYYRPHKDGGKTRAGINFPIQILDTDCLTQWYSDEDMERWPIDSALENIEQSRESLSFHHADKESLTPLKSVSFQEGQCILFNTDIFHDFDNTRSNNIRVMLTLRLKKYDEIYFSNLTKIMFNLD